MSMMAEIAIATTKFMERQSEPGRHPDCLYLGYNELIHLVIESEKSLTKEITMSKRSLRRSFRGMEIYVVDALRHLAVGCLEP